jgi:hypothetical protein
MDVKYSMDTKIEDNTRLFKLQKAQFDQEVNTAVSISRLKHFDPYRPRLISILIHFYPSVIAISIQIYV